MVAHAVKRYSVTIGPDHAVVNGAVVPVVEGQVLGIEVSRDRSWGLQAEGIVLGQSRLFRAEVRRGAARLVPSVDDDFVTVVYVVSGHVEVEPAGGPAFPVGPGQGWFYHEQAEWDVRWTADSSLTLVSVPSGVLREFGIDGGRACGAIPASGTLLRPAAQFIHAAAVPGGEVPPLSGYFLERLTQELVGAVLLANEGFAEEAPPARSQLHARAVALMTAKRADPDLTPESVAADLNVSLRQLQREFQERRTSVAGTLRRLRAELAVQLLRDRSFDALSMEQIAQNSGFASAQSLRRVLSVQGYPSPQRLRGSTVS